MTERITMRERITKALWLSGKLRDGADPDSLALLLLLVMREPDSEMAAAGGKQIQGGEGYDGDAWGCWLAMIDEAAGDWEP